jgi:cell surface protein SprA
MIISALLKKGAIALSVSAFAGMVYASQVHLYQQKKSTQLYHASSIDSPPDTSKSIINTNTGTPDSNPQPKKEVISKEDTTKLHYPIAKTGEGHKSSFDLKDPLTKNVEIDSSLQNFKITQKIGNTTVGETKTVPYKEYEQGQTKQWIQDYFKRRAAAQVSTQRGGLLPKLNLGDPLLNQALQAVDIKPQGSAELIFSEDFNRVQNPTYSLHEQRNAQFKFDQKIQASVTATIGDRIKLGFRYDTQASFDFENQRKLSWEGKDDEIVKYIQAGDVSMPLSSALISGSQSLFGVKAKLQFGKLDVTSIFAQQKSDKKEITLEGGAQTTKFNITADNYDANRHYFLSQYFREHFDQYNANWPSLSNIQITRVEVWVTNPGAATKDTRAVAGFMDLGEHNPFNTQFIHPNHNGSDVLPGNHSNDLYATLTTGVQYRNKSSIGNALGAPNIVKDNFLPTQDYYVIDNARQLQPSEFTINNRLGYISLNQQLNPGDVLAVAFQYTIDGATYQVGEFAADQPPNPTAANVLFVKLLKSVVTNPRLPNWKLMMKNIYSLGAYQVQPTNFKFQVVYEDNKSGSYLNYLPEHEDPSLNGIPIIRLLGMDRINTQQEPKPDGNFDYIEGITINSSNGKIIFPVVEPFGSDLKKIFKDPKLADKYAYQLLYDSTHTFAIQDAVHNKFFLVGSYQGASGSEISLNSINVPQGSVKVYADGVPLVEGSDYTVDYNLGKVRIIKQSILNSGSVIKVTSESNSLFSIQQKTMMGTHLDYHISKNFTVGATALYLRERPLTQKVNIGEEPIRNTILGADLHYNTESRFLTELVNKIPLIQTKEKSNLTAEGEVAYLDPGHPTTLNDPGQSGGVSYLDDFEGSIVPYDLRLGNNWVLASCPQGQPDRFPEAADYQGLTSGFNRAKMSWYVIDNIFFEDLAGLTPPNIIGNNTLLSDPFQRMIKETEVFPNEQIPTGSPGILQTFDLYYHPMVRGPYNFSVNRPMNAEGRFTTNPEKSWAGIQRAIQTTDFEAANIQYIEMWMMDPYTTGTTGRPINGQGQLYIDLGTISEDILHDNRESYENGYQCDTSSSDSTQWGRVPNGLHITTVFDNNASLRPCQDVGYDGLTDDAERRHYYGPYLSQIKSKVSGSVYNSLVNDPSGDNYHCFRGTDFDAANANIIQRYMDFNGIQGNTPTNVGGDNCYGSQNPDDEDINHDFNIEKSEAYFEYRININKTDFVVGRNFVTDKQVAPVALRNGKQQNVNWYQIKIPINEYNKVVGPISDFKSIRFMRIYLTGFNDSVILRFARLQLVRGDWRKYQYSLASPGDPLPADTFQSNLDVSAISLEADGKRPGISYVLPPGIQRQIDYSTPSLIQQNEQSLDLKICGLKEGDGRAIFKNTTLDIRQYKTMKMFVHAEALNNSGLKNGQLHLFIRVGADFTSNYYEYDMPLTVTPLSGASEDSLVWPYANQVKLAMDEWVNLKTARIKAGGSLTIPFTAPAVSSQGTVTVLGNPDIGHVAIIMIGLRHPQGDDKGPTPCAEVWLDELRMTDFDERGGWAAIGRVTAKLADFGRVELTASRQTIGFGGLDQSLQQRNQSDMQSFGVITSFELGKFFPQRYNVRIPMFASYSQTVNTPRYNPLSPDLPLSSLTSAYTDPKKQDSVLQAAQDFTARKSLNFTGVQKLRSQNTTRKPKIYDIENFNFTYIYSEIDRRNITSIYDNQKIYSGQLAYAYNFNNPKSVEPFKKISSKYLKLLSDFNFYYLPQTFSIVGKIDRQFNEKLYRNTDDYETINRPLYDKTFQFSRKYDLKFNLTKSLRLTYSATGLSRIDEPDGLIDSSYKQQIIWNNILKGGTKTDFAQSTGVAYDVPINKLPFLDFTSLQVSYTGNYEWKAAPPIAVNLGNLVQNSQVISANGQLNFLNLYNKNPYLRNIISGSGNAKPDNSSDSLPGQGRNNTKNKTIQPQNNQNAPGDGTLSTGETLLGVLMSIRSVSVSYTLNNGTALPGFMPAPQYIGQDFRTQAPGLPFVFGSQTDIRAKAAANGWITSDTGLSQPYIATHREAITGTAILEPLKSLRINVDFNRTESSTFQEIFRNTGDSGFKHLSPMESGNFSISTIAIGTAFVADGPNNSNATFNDFQNKRRNIAQQLAAQNPLTRGRLGPNNFPYGYSQTNQDVLIPAFIAAYTGSGNGTNIFPSIPLPNWRMTYTGLSANKFFKSFAKQISISSGYHATYSVDNYATNLNYNPLQSDADSNGNFVNKYRIDRITLSERFDPLIGVDVSLVSNWSMHFEYGKERQESFSFTDRKISENKTTRIVFGAGYVTNKLYLPFTGRTKKYLKNEFKFRLDCSINDNKQVVRILDQDEADATGGAVQIAILPNITYVLNKSLTLNIFFKRNVTTPYTSGQYPTALTSIGFSLKYILTP